VKFYLGNNRQRLTHVVPRLEGPKIETGSWYRVPSHQLGNLGERCKLPSRVWGGAPAAADSRHRRAQKMAKNFERAKR